MYKGQGFSHPTCTVDAAGSVALDLGKIITAQPIFWGGVDADGSEADGQPDCDFPINPRRAIESSEPARSDALQPSFQQVRPSRPTARPLKRIAPADNYACQ